MKNMGRLRFQKIKNKNKNTSIFIMLQGVVKQTVFSLVMKRLSGEVAITLFQRNITNKKLDTLGFQT